MGGLQAAVAFVTLGPFATHLLRIAALLGRHAAGDTPSLQVTAAVLPVPAPVKPCVSCSIAECLATGFRGNGREPRVALHYNNVA